MREEGITENLIKWLGKLNLYDVQAFHAVITTYRYCESDMNDPCLSLLKLVSTLMFINQDGFWNNLGVA